MICRLLRTDTLLIFLLMGLVACQKSPEVKIEVWSQGDGSAPSVFSSEQFSQTDRSFLIDEKIVRFSHQRLGPAMIDGGALQRVENKSGELLFGKARTQKINFSTPAKEAALRRILQDLETKRPLFLQRLRERNSNFDSARFLDGPELVLIFRNKRLVPAYKIEILTASFDRVERIWFSPDFVQIRKTTASIGFDADAWVFTLEDRQKLQPVVLSNLEDSPDLRSHNLKVRSQSGLPLLSKILQQDMITARPSDRFSPLRFPIDDPRFDQTQVYFLVEKALSLFANDWGIQLPVAVEVETSVGHPKPTNAAFTYKNQIRLGRGDGEVYGAIAQDPSIVFHEVAHVFIETLAHLPTEGEGGSLNEGFADFFAASLLNSPKMAEGTYLKGPYKRNLEDKINLKQANGGLYHDSQIVSGTLWDLRRLFGVPLSQKLALQTLIHLGPAESLQEFTGAIRTAAKKTLRAEQIEQLEALLKERQWAE